MLVIKMRYQEEAGDPSLDCTFCSFGFMDSSLKSIVKVFLTVRTKFLN